MTGYVHERQERERVQKLSAAARQRAYKTRMAEQGFVQVHGWVRPHQLHDLLVLIHNLQANADWVVGPARNERTGRLHRIR